MMQGLPEEEYWTSGHRACAGCGASIAMRIATKAAGKNTIIVGTTGCMEVVSTPYPETAWKLPYVHGAFENSAAIASGICEALKKQNKDTKVLVIAGDGGTFDIGLQALSGAIERGHKFCFVCYDNEAYENTGIQRSGSTPKYTWTTTTPVGKKLHGKQEYKKHMPFIIASHNEGVYVATANIGFPLDFYNKVKKGLENNGPSYIQVYTPCVPGWKYEPNLTVDICKRAFNSKVTPLYEIEKGVLKFTMKPSQTIPFSEYVKGQGRFRHLNPAEIAEVQEHLDKEYERLLKLEKSGLKIF
jgi:pyruvate ferredoxin oxidoreductase beta subunit